MNDNNMGMLFSTGKIAPKDMHPVIKSLYPVGCGFTTLENGAVFIPFVLDNTTKEETEAFAGTLDISLYVENEIPFLSFAFGKLTFSCCVFNVKEKILSQAGFYLVLMDSETYKVKGSRAAGVPSWLIEGINDVLFKREITPDEVKAIEAQTSIEEMMVSGRMYRVGNKD